MDSRSGASSRGTAEGHKQVRPQAAGAPQPAQTSESAAAAAGQALRELRGVAERITYSNPETGYTVARLVPERRGEDVRAARDGDERLVTVVGPLADLTPGEAILARGWWRNDPKYGWQFVAVDYRTTLPATVQGMKKYLGSGLIKGIGPVNAGRIVDTFGEATFEIVDETPQRLTEVPGIGPVRAARIAATWAEQRQIREVMAALQSFGLSTSLATRIYKRFGDESTRIIAKDPYRLAREVWGIGFKTADKIAQAAGIAPDAPQRLQAGVLHALGEAAGDGHTILPEDALAVQAATLLGVPAGRIEAPIEDLLRSGDLVTLVPLGTGTPTSAGHGADPAGESGTRRIALAPFARAEAGLAARLRTLQRAGERERGTAAGRIFGAVDWPVAFRWLAERHRLSLAPEQEAATRMALTAPVSLLTGGPGTGKTHTLKAVLSLARAKGLRCLLAAPTGRAAKRMSEATGLPAATLHRLLELRPGGRAGRNAGNPLPADLVVVDETSMLDALLANQLLKAIAPGCHLLLVGDPDQLPSVGAGDVLADLLRAGQFPVTRLSHIFRQGAGSGIAANAQLINAGEMPRFGGPTRDCYFLPAETAAEAASVVVDLVARRLPARYGLQRGDVQVLSPMHRGEAGVGALNALLQERLNPSRPGVTELRSAGRVYRPGDRVLQLKNDYDLDVFNGDLGTVQSVDAVEQELVLLLDDGRRVRYPGANLFALTHAYAISVHKCIAGHERVWTARRGLVPIKDIRAGEAIHTGQHALRPVVATMPTGRRRVVRLTTRMGYQIDVSEEHPLLVADAALPRFVPAAQLTPAHYVCLSRQTVDTDAPLSLPATETPATGRSLHLPAQLNEALAWLLGVIVGDGSYRDTRDGTLEISNHDPEVLSECRRILASYGLRVGAYKTPGRRATRLYVTSQTFRRWLSKLGLRSVEANDKTTPALIFHAPVRCRAAFLRGLFDTRGRVSVGATRSCRLVTASSQLATEVQHLLLSLGVISHVSQVTARAFCVGVSGTSIECFKRVVGLTVGYKRDRLRAMLDRPLRPRTTDGDRIPFSRLLMRQVAQTLVHFWGKTRGIKGKGVYAAAGARQPNTSRFAELYAGVTHGNLKLSYSNVRQIRSHLERLGAPLPAILEQTEATNYFYDKIKSVVVTDETTEMYDIEVEGVHSFVANGFVCHNSQGAEFPAVVIPLLTSHAVLLGRTLLYTAVTRARQLVVIVGQRRALGLAVRDWRREPRHTALAALLSDSARFVWPAPAGPGSAGAEPGSATDAEPAEAEDPWEGLLAPYETASPSPPTGGEGVGG